MKKLCTFIFSLIFFSSIIFAQHHSKKDITVEDIFQKNKFKTLHFPGLRWMNDGIHFTDLEEKKDSTYFIIKFKADGTPVDTLFNSKKTNFHYVIENYHWSPDESKLLFECNSEHIYRHSSVAQIYIYDLKSNHFTTLANAQKVSHPTFSPNSELIAYTRANNLYYCYLNDYKEIAITTNGILENIINGSTDWVYEEEFEFAQAFFWSPSSKKIAFYSFDESRVPMYNLQKWYGLYPQDYKYKYPKVGEPNSIVTIQCYDIHNNTNKLITSGTEAEYTPRVSWTSTDDTLAVMLMNRHQNEMEIRHYSSANSKFVVSYREFSPQYLEVSSYWHYLNDNKGFLITSEKDGYRHLYWYTNNGKLKQQITKGNFEVDELLGVDEKTNKVFYISNEGNSTEKHFYSIDLKGKNKVKLSKESGCHVIQISPNYQYYISYFSNFETPYIVRLFKMSDNSETEVFEDNKELNHIVKSEYNTGTHQFFTIQKDKETQLNAWMIYPTNFDPNKKYPVLMYVYGGPGHQTVQNHWMNSYYFWFQSLASQGYIVVSVDNRGTGGKGAEFKKCTYLDLGNKESEDQIFAANYLKSQKYIDSSRIGIWGWSYGGYLSTLSSFKSDSLFKTTIAVAPVTDWNFYDNIYTERYMQTPEENPKGYKNSSTLNWAKHFKTNYLLIHGTGDDNVHLQNSIALQDELIKEGKQFQTFYYPNRAHGISGGATRYHLFKMMTNFILEKL